jgi:hypothetical protein
VSTARHSQSTRHQQTYARTQVRDPRTEGKPQASGGLSIGTLAAASVASVVSAIVVSHIWGPGTLYGTAATPVIIALVKEGLDRPKRAVTNVRQARAFDPLAEGRAGLDEGDFATAAPAVQGGGRTVHQVPTGPRVPHMPKRRSLLIALATGVVAFAIAAFALTGSELVFGSSAVGGVKSRTTLFGGSTHTSKSEKKQKKSSDGGSTTSKPKKRQQTREPKSTSTTPESTTTTPQTVAPGATTPSQTPTGSGGTSTSQTQTTQTSPPPANVPSPNSSQQTSPTTTTPSPTAP